MDLTTRIFSILPQTDEPVFAKELFQIIGYYSQSFLKDRLQTYLLKIAKAKWEISKKLESSLKSERNIYFKLFAVKFQNKGFPRKALGILFAFNFLSEHEQFKKSYLINILRQITPGISVIEDSLFMQVDEANHRLICYCEVEKLKGQKLDFEKGLKLKNTLKEEIINGIQFCPPSTFSPENEETILKNILQLHREITTITDLPQVHISFKDQQAKTLRYTVIIVRIVRENDPLLAISDLSNDIKIELERVDPFLKGYIKETIVFSWKISSSLFYRKNHSIDLLKARQYLSMMLEQIIGEFRDYNGGLLSKQTEQFNSLIGSISNKIDDLSDFEKLFYSLTPSNNQLLISSKIALDFYQMFIKIRKTPLKDSCSVLSLKSDNASILIVKTKSSVYDSIFSNLPKEPLIVKTSLTIHNETFHCLIQFNALDLSFSETVHNRIMALKKQKLPYRKDEIRITFQHPILSFHPHLSSDIRSLTLYKAIFEGLTRINPNGIVELALAEKVNISPCKKIYRFTLKTSKWSNGEKVTSYDFAKSWKRAISSQSSSMGSKDFFVIKNAKLAHQNLVSLEKVGIMTPSETELIIELEYSAPYFLQLVADPVFSPLHQEDLNHEPTAFNGPFLPSIYKLDEKIELNANPLYWDKKSVCIHKLNIEIIEDAYKAYEKYKKEELDLLASPFNLLPEKAVKSSVHFCKTYDPFWLFCNTKNPKLKSEKIRKALSFSIDRKELIKQISPFHKPSYSIIPEDLSFLDVTSYCFEGKKENFIALFEEGLKESSLEKENFFLNLNHSDSLEQKKLCLFLKKVWEKTFSIRVNLIENPWNIHWNTFFNKNYEIGGFYYLTSYKSPFYFMSSFDHYHNYTNWKNKTYQKYFSLAKESLSDKKRKYYLRKSEEILMDEMPVIPICNKIHTLLSKENLKGFPSEIFTYLDLKWTYYEG